MCFPLGLLPINIKLSLLVIRVRVKMSMMVNLTTVHCASHAPSNFPICQHRVPPPWVGLLTYLISHFTMVPILLLSYILIRSRNNNWIYRKEVSIAESFHRLRFQTIDFFPSWILEKILHSLVKFWQEKLKENKLQSATCFFLFSGQNFVTKIEFIKIFLRTDGCN